MERWLPKSRIGKGLLVVAAGLLALVFSAALLLKHYWPFTEGAVRRRLGEAASASVRFHSFKPKYFPPGCIAEGVVFQREQSGPPLITIERLTIRSSFLGMLHHHVSIIRAEGARVNWQKEQSKPDPKSPVTVVDRLIADDAVLDVPRSSPSKSLQFVFHKLEVKNLGGGGQSSFIAKLDNPLPHGLLLVSGHFGPWDNLAREKTALDGEYSLQDADLSELHSVEGLVSSQGRFRGTFDNLAVQGLTSTPELTVVSTHHGLPLKTEFLAQVNGATGDVMLRWVRAQFGKDDLREHGSIARNPSGSRVAALAIECEHGTIEDTFHPFIHSAQSPVTGNVRFRMQVTIPPGKEKFEKKLGLASTFDIENARFTSEQTQLSLSKIAQVPDQKRPDPTVPASIRGRVSVGNGVAQFSELVVTDQDARADLNGEFGLLDQRVKLHGELTTAASLAKATHGIKAAFAKVIEQFFKKKPHEMAVPVRITGTYRRPQFGLDLSKRM